MTYADQHTKARPGKWVGGLIVGFELCSGARESVPIWSDGYFILSAAKVGAVLVVTKALDKMTR